MGFQGALQPLLNQKGFGGGGGVSVRVPICFQECLWYSNSRLGYDHGCEFPSEPLLKLP